MLTTITAAETFIQMIFFCEYNEALLIIIKIHTFCKLIVHDICNVSKVQKVQEVQLVSISNQPFELIELFKPFEQIPNPKQLGFINVQSLSATSATHHLCLQ